MKEKNVLQPTVLHLVRGQYEVKWYESEAELKECCKSWPPQSSGGCELRVPDKDHAYMWCENLECDGVCRLNGMLGGDGNIYWYCVCIEDKA